MRDREMHRLFAFIELFIAAYEDAGVVHAMQDIDGQTMKHSPRGRKRDRTHAAVDKLAIHPFFEGRNPSAEGGLSEMILLNSVEDVRTTVAAFDTHLPLCFSSVALS